MARPGEKSNPLRLLLWKKPVAPSLLRDLVHRSRLQALSWEGLALPTDTASSLNTGQSEQPAQRNQPGPLHVITVISKFTSVHTHSAVSVPGRSGKSAQPVKETLVFLELRTPSRSSNTGGGGG